MIAAHTEANIRTRIAQWITPGTSIREASAACADSYIRAATAKTGRVPSLVRAIADRVLAVGDRWEAERLAGGQPVDPEMEAFLAAEEARGPLAGAPDQLDCYRCGTVQTVTALGKVADHADPTQSYRLACGHTTI